MKKRTPRSGARSTPAARKPAKAKRADDSTRGTNAKGFDAAKRGTSEQGAVRLLSGGNPQIAKADGDAPVQAYIAAMPGWKSALGKRLDAIIVRSVPNVRKAVRWNSPFYGAAGRGSSAGARGAEGSGAATGADGKSWFLAIHCLTRYVKVNFFDGLSLRPIPPGGTARSGQSRWIDIYEDDTLDEAQFAAWVKQAAALPGWTP